MEATNRQLTYSIEEFGKAIGTKPDNISLLITGGYIKAMSFGKKGKKITICEAERFLIENAGTDFESVLEDLRKRRQLEKANNKVIQMKEVAR